MTIRAVQPEDRPCRHRGRRTAQIDGSDVFVCALHEQCSLGFVKSHIKTCIGCRDREEEKSRGLGDTVARFTRATGIERIVKAVKGGDCQGCDERQEWLNRLVPYRSGSQSSIVKPQFDPSQVEFLIKSFRRFNCLWRCVHSIKHWWPEATIRIADDSLETGQAYPPIVECLRERPGVHWYQLPFDSGLSKGRNLLVNAAETPYVVLFDDDFVATEETRIPQMLAALEEDPSLGLLAGIQRGDNSSNENLAENWGGVLTKQAGEMLLQPPAGPWRTLAGLRVQQVDLAINFFVARREVLQRCPWDERLKIIWEHEDHFLTFRKNGVQVACTPDSVILHQRGSYGENQRYRTRAGRERRHIESLLNEKWELNRFPNFQKYVETAAEQRAVEELTVPLRDRPNLLILTVGRSGSSIVTRMLHRLGWCPGDADHRGYHESRTAWQINEGWRRGKPFDATAAARLLEETPQPWAIKHTGFQLTWREWLPHLEPFTPTLLWITRDLEAVAASYRRLGWPTPGGLSCEENHQLCTACYEGWPWEKLKFDVEEIAGALGEFDAEQVIST